jgi:hypothetical protein
MFELLAHGFHNPRDECKLKSNEREKRMSAPWIMFENWIMTNTDAPWPTVKEAQMKKDFQYYGRFSMKPTSQSVGEKQFGLIYDTTQFDSLFRYLIKTMITHGKEFQFPDRELYHALVDAIESTRSPNPVNSTPSVFLTRPGRLFLILAASEEDDCHQIIHNDMEFSVLSGVWVSAVGAAVIYNHEIDDLVMDTTFKVIRRYHTASLPALIHNVGFPLAFSLGLRECIELYDRFSTAFRDELNTDLSQYILLSDQGAALKVIG